MNAPHVLSVSSLLPLPSFRPDNNIILKRGLALRKMGINITFLRPLRWPLIPFGFSTQHIRVSKQYYTDELLELPQGFVLFCRVADANPPHWLRHAFGIQTPARLRRYINRFWAMPPNVTNIVLSGDYNIVHSEYIFPDAIIGRMLAERLRAKHIVTVREMHFRNLLNSSVVRDELIRADAVITTSVAIALFAKSRDIKNVGVIPHYVEDAFYATKLDNKSNIVKLVTIGRLLRYKNIDMVIKALSNLDAKCQWAYDIIGDGPEVRHLERLVHEAALHSRVRFLGELENSKIAYILKDYDYMVLPSWFEAFGIVYAEALASGLGIVCVRQSGIWGYVESGKGIYFIDNPSDVSNAINLIMKNYKGDRVCANSRRAAAEQFRMARGLGMYMDLYKRLAN